MSDEYIKAIVQKVYEQGPHGPYAIAKADGSDGSITFSLEPTVWQENEFPKPGEVVHLSRLRKKRAGWRAKQARYLVLSDEQIANRKEQEAMKSLTAYVEQLRLLWQSGPANATWRKWVDHQERWTENLIALLKADVNIEFKKRALFLLLVPDKKYNPLYWKDKLGKFYCGQSFLDNLSPELACYAAEVISKFFKNLLLLKDKERYLNALHTYNRGILQLLPQLPKEKAEDLFKLFHINDFTSYWSPDKSSGYNPLELLFWLKIDEKWKIIADLRIREIIKDELEGRKQPREEWEDALSFYYYFINYQLETEERCYSIELLADQLRFLLSITDRSSRRLIEQYRLNDIIDLFSQSDPDLCYALARHIVLYNDDEFSVYDANKQGVMTVIELYGDQDPELKAVLKQKLAKWEERERQKQEEDQQISDTEDSILAEMK